MSLANPFRRAANKIREINQRYAVPRIRMSGTKRAVLLGLRIYLLILVVLLAYRFFTLFSP